MFEDDVFGLGKEQIVVPFEKASTVILFDGHNTMFRMAGSQYLSNMRTAKGLPTGHIFGFYRTVLSIWERFADVGSTSLVFGFDGPEGKEARRQVMSEYKTRDASLTSLFLGMDRDALFDDISKLITCIPHNSFISTSVEFDDVAAHMIRSNPNKNFYLVSNDRDLWALLGNCKNLTIITDNVPVTLTHLQQSLGLSDFSHITLYKVLFGDSSDTVPSCLPKVTKAPVIASVIAKFGLGENLNLQDVVEALQQEGQKPLTRRLAACPDFLAKLKKNLGVIAFQRCNLKDCLSGFNKGDKQRLIEILTKYECDSFLDKLVWF